MIVSHEHELIFVKTRKTAGTSIEVLLAKMLEDGAIVTPIDPPAEGHVPRNYGPPALSPLSLPSWRALVSRHRLSNGLWFYNHMPARVARARIGRSVWNRYFKFCFERNPWDKTLSWYYFLTRNAPERIEFPKFVQTRTLPVDWGLYTIRDDLAVDYVGRFEKLGADLREVLRRVGLPSEVEVPFEKAGLRPRDARVEVVYDAESSRVVREAFSREIEAFGFAEPSIPDS